MQPTLCRLLQFILLISQIVSPAQTTQGVPQRGDLEANSSTWHGRPFTSDPVVPAILLKLPLKIPCLLMRTLTLFHLSKSYSSLRTDARKRSVTTCLPRGRSGALKYTVTGQGSSRPPQKLPSIALFLTLRYTASLNDPFFLGTSKVVCFCFSYGTCTVPCVVVLTLLTSGIAMS